MTVEKIDSEYYFAIFKYKYSPKYSFGEKLRHIWSILKDGHPFTDNIILRKEDASTLSNFLKD